MVPNTKIWKFLPVAGLICLNYCGAGMGAPSGPPAGQAATLEWSASLNATVTGYYLYCGTSPGVYTNKMDVGTNTAFTVTGLALGSTYYFATTSHTAARDESNYSDEVAYTVPGILAATLNVGKALMHIQFPVAPGHSYQLQFSPDLKTWSNLWLTEGQTTNGWIEYNDSLANAVPARFYRLILH